MSLLLEHVAVPIEGERGARVACPFRDRLGILAGQDKQGHVEVSHVVDPGGWQAGLVHGMLPGTVEALGAMTVPVSEENTNSGCSQASPTRALAASCEARCCLRTAIASGGSATNLWEARVLGVPTIGRLPTILTVWRTHSPSSPMSGGDEEVEGGEVAVVDVEAQEGSYLGLCPELRPFRVFLDGVDGVDRVPVDQLPARGPLHGRVEQPAALVGGRHAARSYDAVHHLLDVLRS